MFRRIFRYQIFVVILAAGWWWWPWRAIRHEPGVLVSRVPVQTDLPARRLQPIDGYSIEAIARYEITARILRTKRYWRGPGSDLVPYDVAVGWGPMSDQSVLDGLHITQGNRFFFYAWERQPPIPQAQIQASASNMHVISANGEVASTVRSLRAGEIVTMHGFLVNVAHPSGFTWRSSLSRTDGGNGACEVFYVEKAQRTAL